MRIVTHENFYGMKFLAKKYRGKKGRESFTAVTGLSKSTQSKLINSRTFSEYEAKYEKKDSLNDGIAEYKDWKPEDSMVGSVGLFIKGWSKVAFWVGAALFIWIVLSLK